MLDLTDEMWHPDRGEHLTTFAMPSPAPPRIVGVNSVALARIAGRHEAGKQCVGRSVGYRRHDGADRRELGLDGHADLAGLRGTGNRFNGLVDLIRGQGHFQLDLRQQIHRVFGAPVQLGVTFLAAETTDFGDRHALHASLGQRFAHGVETERLDDGDEHFHYRILVPAHCPSLTRAFAVLENRRR